MDDVNSAVLDGIATQLRRDHKRYKDGPLYRIKREVIRLHKNDFSALMEVDGITVTLTKAFSYRLEHGVYRMRLIITVTTDGCLGLWTFLASERFRYVGAIPFAIAPLSDPNCFEVLASGLARLNILYTPPQPTNQE